VSSDNSESQSIEPLKTVPAAFAPLAVKINEVVAELNRIRRAQLLRANAPLEITEGDSGPAVIDLSLEELGNMLRANSKNGGGGIGGDTYIVGSNEGAAVEVPGSDGKLVKVVRHSTATTPTTYMTALTIYNTTCTVVQNASGITITNASSKSIALASSVTQNIAFREVSVCDGGVAKKMLIFGSVLYT
jgi:hypothetical protein